MRALNPGKSPLVSIAIPVFEKEQHLAQTLDVALAQDHRNLEVILADNGSSDRSVDICREYAARDRRVRFVQNRGNLGSRRNFNLVFELARGEYFMWARGHDLWSRDHVSRGVAVMESDREVVLFHTRCQEIDAAGAVLGVVDETLDTRGKDLAARLTSTWRSAIGPATLGLIRTAAMDHTRLYQDLAGCDIVFLLELAVRGAFAFAEEPRVSLRRTRVEGSEDETVLRTWAQLNPFRMRNVPPSDHVLEFTQSHLRVIGELAVSAAERDDLLADLVAVYREKFKGSFERALDSITERIQRAVQVGAKGSDGALDCAAGLALLDRLNLGLLFLPEHARAVAARDLLLAFFMNLSEVVAAEP